MQFLPAAILKHSVISLSFAPDNPIKKHKYLHEMWLKLVLNHLLSMTVHARYLRNAKAWFTLPISSAIFFPPGGCDLKCS
jgi:hypothetical protein